jgi:AhpD family alkylhydroperoxidase
MNNTATIADTEAVKLSERIDLGAIVPKAYGFLTQYDTDVTGTLDQRLAELIRIRVSSLNGCAYCVNAHTAAALALGETSTRLQLLPVWQEAPVFTARERAALALADEGTSLMEGGVSDTVWNEAAQVFSEDELARIVAVIASINAWNRLVLISRKQF